MTTSPSPSGFSVLLARIRAALRQHDQSEDVVFTIGPYSFQPAAKLLEAHDGGKVRLTDKETSILKYLYRQGPQDHHARRAAQGSLGLQQPGRRPTRSRPTSTGCARRSSAIRPMPGCW